VPTDPAVIPDKRNKVTIICMGDSEFKNTTPRQAHINPELNTVKE